MLRFRLLSEYRFFLSFLINLISSFTIVSFRLLSEYRFFLWFKIFCIRSYFSGFPSPFRVSFLLIFPAPKTICTKFPLVSVSFQSIVSSYDQMVNIYTGIDLIRFRLLSEYRFFLYLHYMFLNCQDEFYSFRLLSEYRFFLYWGSPSYWKWKL